MSALRHPLKLDEDHQRELAERLRLAEADHEPVVLEIAGERYRLVPEAEVGPRLTDDPAAGYDPAAVHAAIDAGFGAFSGMDVDAFLEEILEERVQDTPGHSY